MKHIHLLFWHFGTLLALTQCQTDQMLEPTNTFFCATKTFHDVQGIFEKFMFQISKCKIPARYESELYAESNTLLGYFTELSDCLGNGPLIQQQQFCYSVLLTIYGPIMENLRKVGETWQSIGSLPANCRGKELSELNSPSIARKSDGQCSIDSTGFLCHIQKFNIIKKILDKFINRTAECNPPAGQLRDLYKETKILFGNLNELSSCLGSAKMLAQQEMCYTVLRSVFWPIMISVKRMGKTWQEAGSNPDACRLKAVAKLIALNATKLHSRHCSVHTLPPIKDPELLRRRSTSRLLEDIVSNQILKVD